MDTQPTAISEPGCGVGQRWKRRLMIYKIGKNRFWLNRVAMAAPAKWTYGLGAEFWRASMKTKNTPYNTIVNF